jgi:hypothetical protein
LSRTVLLQGRARNRDSDLIKDDVSESEDIVEDPAVAHSTSSEPFTCGQSVAFSPTFQVPVFYFIIHDSRALLLRQRREGFAQEKWRRRFPAHAGRDHGYEHTTSPCIARNSSDTVCVGTTGRIVSVAVARGSPHIGDAGMVYSSVWNGLCHWRVNRRKKEGREDARG